MCNDIELNFKVKESEPYVLDAGGGNLKDFWRRCPLMAQLSQYGSYRHQTVMDDASYDTYELNRLGH